MLLTPMELHLKDSWGTLWGAVTKAWPGLPGLLGLLAAVFAIIAIVSWLWQKRKNVQAGDNKGMQGAILIALLLAAPEFILPFALGLFDAVGNFILNVISGIK